MSNALLYRIALTLVPHIGDRRARALINVFGDAAAVFAARKKDLERVEGIGSAGAKSIRDFSDFARAEAEAAFIEKYKITPLFITDPAYPQRLLNCYDSPILLYYRGNADLNHHRILSVVGTRNNSDYGKKGCEDFIEALKKEDILVVSGLAFGIDTIAHKTALKQQLPTVGVLAHGLDMIYPPQNKSLAKQMTANGGLLTEFPGNSNPDKTNFPRRNRIVAGICDALLVVESSKKGGSLITAELGNGYNKDVFAIPGRINDSKSEGCNYLIKSNKASLVTHAGDLLEMMNWKQIPDKKGAVQKSLFIELSADEKAITGILQKKEMVHIDELYFQSGLSSSGVAAALLMLEMQGIVTALPGKMFRLS